jgi:hypothetical protein
MDIEAEKILALAIKRFSGSQATPGNDDSRRMAAQWADRQAKTPPFTS